MSSKRSTPSKKKESAKWTKNLAKPSILEDGQKPLNASVTPRYCGGTERGELPVPLSEWDITVK